MGVRLNRSPSTISYELSRCQPYQAELAQTDAEYKRSRCGRKTKLSDELKQKILNHLRLSWSPGMIAHEFKLATKSIYNWLNQGRIGFSLNDLPEHGVRQRRNVDQRSKYNQSLGRSIEQRPMMINQRNCIGDLFYLMNEALPDLAFEEALVYLLTALKEVKATVEQILDNFIKLLPVFMQKQLLRIA